ncbi:Platelet-activating factor acetylhydrolase [Fusarium oxysporum f. sp. albedinis]|nr:Platelet-activating factor acetylhydrolase [Fusarium oxysporum f. sp. albedinis]
MQKGLGNCKQAEEGFERLVMKSVAHVSGRRRGHALKPMFMKKMIRRISFVPWESLNVTREIASCCVSHSIA